MLHRRHTLYVALVALLAVAGRTHAQQAASPHGDFQRQATLGIWSKDRFADSVVVSGISKTIYLSGMGAEDPVDGHIQYLGDVYKQCQAAYSKIKDALGKQDATMADIVKTTVYVTDARFGGDYAKCKNEALAGAPLGTHTFVAVSSLAHPGMLLEIDVTAVTAAK